MANTRINHDLGVYKQHINESVGPLEYKLATPQQCSDCFVNDPQLIQQRSGVSVSSNFPMIDVDSDLMGITRKLTKDPNKKYMASFNGTRDPSGQPADKYSFNPSLCNQPKVESTLMSNPPQNLKGTGWNRWEWLFHNPQDMIERPFDWNSNSNLLARDTHRPCIPTPVSQDLVFPIPKKEHPEDLYQYNKHAHLPLQEEILSSKRADF